MLDSIGRWEQALEVAEDTVESYGIADSHESGLLLGRRGAQLEREGDREGGRADFDEIEAIGERTDDGHLLAVADLNRGASDLQWQTVDDETVERLERAVERAECSDDDRTLARALNNLSRVQDQLANFDEAESVLERCLAVRETIGDRSALAQTKHNLADLYRRNGAFDDALALHEAAAETAEIVNNDVLLAGSAEEAAEIHRARGDLTEAERSLEATVDALEALGHRRFVASRTAWLAATVLDRGEDDRARDLADEAVETAADAGHPLDHAATLAVRGAVHLDADELDDAVADFRRGLDLLAEVDDPVASDTEVALAGGLADALARRGEVDAAGESLARARSALDPGEFPARVAPLAVVEARVGRLGGDRETASEAAAAALTDARAGATRWAVGACEAHLELARIAAERGDEAAVAEHCRVASDLVGEHGIGRFEGVPGRIERGDGRNA
jgi:tetratricopeptide (TPR) repeat protein